VRARTDGVETLTRGGLGSLYRIGRVEVFVGNAVPLKGTTIDQVGQVGQLVLPRWFCERHELAGGRLA
jgi:hypothetical protein